MRRHSLRFWREGRFSVSRGCCGMKTSPMKPSSQTEERIRIARLRSCLGILAERAAPAGESGACGFRSVDQFRLPPGAPDGWRASRRFRRTRRPSVPASRNREPRGSGMPSFSALMMAKASSAGNPSGSSFASLRKTAKASSRAAFGSSTPTRRFSQAGSSSMASARRRSRSILTSAISSVPGA